MIHPSREFEDAVSALCHGTATEMQVQELATLLRTDTAAQDAYLLAVELHARLASDNGLFVRSPNHGTPAVGHCGEVGRPAPSARAVRGSPDPAPIATDRSQAGCGRPTVGRIGEVGRPTPSARSKRQRRARYLTLGATAAVVLIGLVIWKFFGVETNGLCESRVAVQVLEAQHVVPDDWQAGQTVSLNQLNITSGMLQVRIADSGVRLRVSGPAELRLVDPMLARVVRGQVTADVDEQGKGFSMETAQAKLVDLGTQFGVDVSDRDTTDVVVFRGTVQVFKDHRDQRRDRPLSTLTEGEAVRVGAGRTMARIPNIVSRPMPSRWTTAAPMPEECVIASVRDNLRSPDTKLFYEIVPGGLAEGVQAYVGPRHLWKGRTPTGLPPYLIGADFVRTFVSDHRKQNLAITVTCSRPAVLYVLFECRPQQQRWREAGDVELAPKWLYENFQKTGDAAGLDDAGQLQSGEAMTAEPGQGHLVTFDVWKREIREPGEVTLGPPTGSDGWLNWMYGIAATPRAP